MESVLPDLLQQENTIFDSEIKALKNWNLWPTFEYYVKALKKEYLYQSHIHGVAHIERVLLFGGLIAMQNHCNEEDTKLLLIACSYHDIGRIDDSLDDDHGRRSSEKLPSVISLSSEDMAIVQAAIYSHSIDDSRMENVIASFGILDKARAIKIAKILKDADALDRVRVYDLDPNYLRFPCSCQYVNFANSLYSYYRNLLGY
ncbi:MAG: HD domain-containing protein [Lachnospiraceae bacterium]|nr:HD domain-containing protein [Lachnospiraceae bacterium]